MTVSTAEPPPEKTSRRRRSEAVVDGSAPEPPKLRRRPMLIAVSVLLTAVGAILGATLLTGLSGTDSYIAVREDIQRGDVIEETDLVRTQLRADSAVSPVLWDEQQFVVGQHAAVDMAAGSLVTAESVEQQSIPPYGETVVGMALTPGQTVSGDLKTGDPVRVVLIPTSADTATAPEDVDGTIANVEMSSDGTTKLVDVIVPVENAPDVAAAAARQEVSVVRESTQKDGGAGTGDEGSGSGEESPGSGEESPGSDESSPSS